jgi:hypothetical protein
MTKATLPQQISTLVCSSVTQEAALEPQQKRQQPGQIEDSQ